MITTRVADASQAGVKDTVASTEGRASALGALVPMVCANRGCGQVLGARRRALSCAMSTAQLCLNRIHDCG
jgi:hypothetical protein